MSAKYEWVVTVESTYDVIIIGAGVAGLMASIYASRLNLNTLVISRDLGGQAILAPEIQNFPGFLSISGIDLVKRIEEQAKAFGTRIIFDEVTYVRREDNVFKVETLSKATYHAITLILALGKAPRELNVPGEDKFKGRGVSYCSICDAPLFRNRIVALVGIGESGLHSALMLSDVVKKCYWIFPDPKPGTIESELLENVKNRDNIELLPRSKVIEIKGDVRVRSVVVKDLSSEKLKEIEVDGVFIEMGYVPKTDPIKDLVKLNEKGEVIVNKLCETSCPGVFAAGDITDLPYKQAVISAAQGAIAALSAYNYIAKVKGYKRIARDWKYIPVKREEGELFLGI